MLAQAELAPPGLALPIAWHERSYGWEARPDYDHGVIFAGNGLSAWPMDSRVLGIAYEMENGR